MIAWSRRWITMGRVLSDRIEWRELAISSVVVLWAFGAARDCAVGQDEHSLVMPLRGATLEIRLGLNDKRSTPWHGTIATSGGKLLGLVSTKPKEVKVDGNKVHVGKRTYTFDGKSLKMGG